MLEARESVRNLPTYHPPLGGRAGLRLDFNENTVGCSPKVLARLREITAEELACYPERGPVEAVVAGHLGIEANELLLTNGVDEAIHLLCETFLEPGNEALIAVPTFAMYEIFAAATGAHVIAVPAGADFRFPTSDVLSKITPYTRLVAVANPNNPTGQVAERSRTCSKSPAVHHRRQFWWMRPTSSFMGKRCLDNGAALRTCSWRERFPKRTDWPDFALACLPETRSTSPLVSKVSSPTT